MKRTCIPGMLSGFAVALGALACAGPAAETSRGPKNAEVARSDKQEQPAPDTPDSQPHPVVTSDNFPPPLPARVQAGELQREDLLNLLDAGVPRFLAQLEVKAEKQEGRFVGWRLLAIRPDRWSTFVLQPGDLVLRVNSHGLERPEQFMQVWEGLRGATEVVFEIMRGDQPSEIRFTITDEPLPVTQAIPESG